jgi:hypothetical protein
MNKRSMLTLLLGVVLSVVTIFVALPLHTQAAPLSQSELSESLKVAVEKAVVAFKAAQPKAGMVVTLFKSKDTWAHGSVALRVEEEHGSPDVMLFLARQTSGGWQVALEPTPTFDEWLKLVPTTVVPTATKSLLRDDLAAPQGDGSAQLSLPWATGETVYLTGGPHANLRQALDFSGGTRIVRSAREGVA